MRCVVLRQLVGWNSPRPRKHVTAEKEGVLAGCVKGGGITRAHGPYGTVVVTLLE